ncbi:MAG: phosphoserine phosphatase SerB [Alphaproteobacteria bacterium]|nr:phosphoserine phosphatase SerB [Alphaproteobacteria bacterium]
MFVATLVAPQGVDLSDAQLSSFVDVTGWAGGIVDRSTRIDGRAADVFFSGASPEIKDMPFDVIIQPAAGRRKKILIADMESTIIEQEMLDELAAEIGVGAKVADITRRAMNGELDFADALKERVNLLKNHSEGLLHQVAARMTVMPGAETLVASMKRDGGRAWLVSGGFTCFAKIVAQRLGFDDCFANELIVEKGVMTGDVGMPILDKDSKAALLKRACDIYGCGIGETLAVGDGANDVPMLQACHNGGGLAVAFHAKPRVREIVANQINHGDLSALVYAQGLVP